MLPVLIRVSTLVLLGALVSGCGLLPFGKSRRRPGMESALAEVRRAPLAIGRVALVNAEEHFVLIEANQVQSPVAGTALRTYTGNSVSAELRATGVRRRPFLVADFTSGLPKKGDLVVQHFSSATPPAITAPPPTTPAPPRKRWLGLFRGRE